jgi:hypothetical protein
MKNKQCNGDKNTNNDLQNKKLDNTYPIKNGDELTCSGRASSFYPIGSSRHVTAKRYEHHLTWEFEKFEDTKEAFRSRKPKDRQHNGH